jgi:hypothetical protein
MLKLIAADGTVKQVFPGAVSVQYVPANGPLRARLWSATAVIAEVKLQDGETIQES